VFTYERQVAETIDVYSDTDWAGCTRTRKSTSGGCMMIGSHIIKTWSSTQASLALSSGEAEYYGVVRATGVGLGHQALMRDAGMRLPLRVWTDSSAAIGTAGRQGLGKLRHLECHSLWLQQRLRRKEFELRKVLGTDNPADLFTKHLESAKRLEHLMGMFSCSFMQGRAATAPSLKKASTGQGTSASVAAVVELSVLPHFLSREMLEANFPRFEAPDEAFGEADVDPETELADPVPALAAARSRKQRGVATPQSTTVPPLDAAPQRVSQVNAGVHMVRDRSRSPEVKAAETPPGHFAASAAASTNPSAFGPRSVGRCFGADSARGKTGISTSRPSTSEAASMCTMVPGVASTMVPGLSSTMVPWVASTMVPWVASTTVPDRSARTRTRHTRDAFYLQHLTSRLLS
jgi:hypothetical protein